MPGTDAKPKLACLGLLGNCTTCSKKKTVDKMTVGKMIIDKMTINRTSIDTMIANKMIMSK